MKVSAFEQLKQLLQSDLDYAWTFHCMLACPIMDEFDAANIKLGDIEHEIANKAAARIMIDMFEIDTTKLYEYKEFGYDNRI